MAYPESVTPAERARLQKQQRDLLGALKTVNAELADLSWTLAELEQQIAALAADQHAQHEAAAARRIGDLQRWRSAIEERVLRHMFRADALAAELAALFIHR